MGIQARFELYKDKRGEFRWTMVGYDGQIIRNSEERYKSKDSAKAGIESVQKQWHAEDFIILDCSLK